MPGPEASGYVTKAYQGADDGWRVIVRVPKPTQYLTAKSPKQMDIGEHVNLRKMADGEWRLT